MHDQPTDYSTNDLFPVGRRRKPNFTDNEVLTIINQYEMYKEVLHSREASKSVIAQKQAIWKRITDTLNTSYPQVERTVEDVRRKWKKLQSEAKREAAAHRQAQLSGTTTSIWTKQNNLYERILNICRPSPALHAFYTRNSNVPPQSETTYNEQSSDKNDSPASDLANGNNVQIDSPGEESASLILDNDDNQSSPTATHPFHQTTPSTTMNNQVSKRTLDKRRKLMKSSGNQLCANTMTKSSSGSLFQQQQHSLRYESLVKRKRTLELTSQKLFHDRECLLIERKNLGIKLESNHCETERINIEKRRVELALQKLQNDLPSPSNGNNTNHHLSDQEDHEDNNSVDDISDLNE